MDEQNELPTPEPIQGSKNPWVIIVSIVITALIFGGGVYAWQNSNLKTTEKNFQQEITLLQNQISQLQQTQVKQDELNTNEPVDSSDDEQSNWKVYTNDLYNFSFEYPNSWILSEKSGTYPDDSKYIYIIIENDDEKFIVSPLSNYVLFQDGIWNENKENIIIDEKSALKTIYTPDSNQNWGGNIPTARTKIEFTSIPEGWNNLGTINQIAGGNNDFSALDEILNTFEFTK